jgi:hypothetical protein
LSGPLRGGWWSAGAHDKQVESCFLNHNSSIHFCCTDSLLMTHRGGLSMGIIIWRIGGVSFCLGAQNSLGGPVDCIDSCKSNYHTIMTTAGKSHKTIKHMVMSYDII